MDIEAMEEVATLQVFQGLSNAKPAGCIDYIANF